MHQSLTTFRRMMINTKLQPTRVKYVAPKDQVKMWRIVRGDEVFITSGKEKGKTGTVKKVLRSLNSLLISDRNMVTKHIRPQPEDPTKATKIQIEAPIHVSNVSLIDPQTRQPVRTHYRAVEDPVTGKSERKRFVVGTEVEVPKPKADIAKYKLERVDSPKDTSAKDAREVTFIPDINIPPFPSKSILDELRNPYSKFR
ncbi:large subunit ribosomal protein L24 [Entomortierella parvispora]|uniref:Large subunit ribosomal protein L24 n=1 Tax=Entomortierella parvispora TaxID=205924 RepID=A0A9P3H5C0_9FUNG|nr:large subunit ribosomal protein L24 [Entomortierella parvispora]